MDSNMATLIELVNYLVDKLKNDEPLTDAEEIEINIFLNAINE